MRRRYFKVGHRDKAEPAIINALVAAGDSVAKIGGKDLPDLAVGSKGVTYLLEIKSELSREGEKDGAKRKPRKGKLKQGQEDFRLSWLGGPVVVAYTPEEALQKVGHSQAEIAQAREWSKGWTKRLTPEQRAALVRALPGYTPPRGPGVDAARQADEVLSFRGVDFGGPSRVIVSFGDRQVEVTGLSDAEMAEKIASLINGCPAFVPFDREKESTFHRVQRIGGGFIAEDHPLRKQCPACKVDPQDPCRHDGEERGVALGLIPPRRTTMRMVDRLMAEQERQRATPAVARR